MTSIKYKLSGETIWKVVQIDFQISLELDIYFFVLKFKILTHRTREQITAPTALEDELERFIFRTRPSKFFQYLISRNS